MASKLTSPTTPLQLNYLAGINRAFGWLLQENDFERGLVTSLEIISEMVESSATLLCEVNADHPDHVDLTATLVLFAKDKGYDAAWPGSLGEISNKEGWTWIETLSQGRRIGGRAENIVQHWREVIEKNGVEVSCFLLFPLIVNQRLWGIIGIGHGKEDKRWTDEQKQVVDIYGTTLANVIARRQTEDFLRRDIEERRRIQANLEEARRLSQQIVMTIPDYLFLINIATGRTEYRNVDELLGYSIPEEANPLAFFIELVHPDDQAKAVESFFQQLGVIGDDEIIEGEYRVFHRDGRLIWIYERVKIFERFPDGTPHKYLVDMQDITEKKLVMQQIEESERRYRNFVTYSEEGIYYMNTGRPIPIDLPVIEQTDLYYEHAFIEESNLAMARMYGYQSPEEMIGLRIAIAHGGEHEELNRKSFSDFAANGYRVDNALTIEQDLEGNRKYFLNRAVGIIEDKHLVGMWGIQADVTAEKEAEAALAASELRLSRIIENAQVGVWEWFYADGYILFNDNCARMLSYERDGGRVSVSKVASLMDRQDRAIIGQQLSQRMDRFDIEARLHTADGNFRWMHFKGQVTERDNNGMPLRLTGVQLDIDHKKRAEIVLRESEALLRSLFDDGPLGIAYLDSDGRIFRINQQLCDLLGVDTEDIIHKTLFDFIDPEYEETLHNLTNATVREEPSPANYEVSFHNTNGDRVWNQLAVSHIFNDNNKHQYSIAFFEDITERRRSRQALKASEALLKATLNALPDLKMRVDQKGLVLDVYDAPDEQRRVRLHPRELIGSRLSAWLPPFVTEGLWHNMQMALVTGKVQSFEFVLTDNDQLNFYEARINAIDHQELIMVMRNVSERRHAQQALQEKIRELDVKNRQLQHYIDSNLQLENFAYIASHDLREPIRTMRTFAQLLRRQYEDQLDQTGNTYLDFIVNGAGQMNQLIEDLLTYSRVNSEQHKGVLIPVKSLLDEVCGGLASMIEERQATIDYEQVDAELVGSPTKLKQLFQNLIVNAIKFRHPDRLPHVTISCGETNAYWQFAVKDNGIGIEPSLQEHVFLLFKKFGPKKDQGTGIGLALCKKIVEQHGGEIWVDSRPGHGAGFLFTISK